MFESRIVIYKSLLMGLLLLNTCSLASAEEAISLGEFMLEISVIDQGRAKQVLDLTKVTHPQSQGSFHNSTRVASPSQLEYTSEKNLRFVFNKPIVLHSKNSHQDILTYPRLVAEVEVELSPRLRSHFEMAYLNRSGDLLASMDVLDYSLDFLEEAKELSRLKPKDFSDGSFYRIPVITKALKDIRLPFVPLEHLLVPKPKLSQTSVEFQTLEIAQINPQNLTMTSREFRLMNLSETMASLSSQSKETQDLVHFRSSALRTRNEASFTGWARPEVPHRMHNAPASILAFPSDIKLCRFFLGPGSLKTTADILPLGR